MSLTSKLMSLLSSANATTGESDTTLTQAVNRLISGYGGGGGETIGRFIGNATSQAVYNTTYGEMILPAECSPASSNRKFLILPTEASTTANRNPILVLLFAGKIGTTDRFIGTSIIYTGGSGAITPALDEDGHYYIAGSSNVRFLNGAIYKCYEITV